MHHASHAPHAPLMHPQARPLMHPMHHSCTHRPAHSCAHLPCTRLPCTHSCAHPPCTRRLQCTPLMRPPTLKRAACAEVEQLTYGELMPREIEAFIVTVTLAMVASARGWRESTGFLDNQVKVYTLRLMEVPNNNGRTGVSLKQQYIGPINPECL